MAHGPPLEPQAVATSNLTCRLMTPLAQPLPVLTRSSTGNEHFVAAF